MTPHTPGCTYQAECRVCSWKSNIGDSDNAFNRAWDHREEASTEEVRHEFEIKEASHDTWSMQMR